MRVRGSFLVVLVTVAGLAGCSNYYFGSSDANCFVEHGAERFGIRGLDNDFLRFWRSTEYCRRLREEFARSFQASLPDFGVLRPQQVLVSGTQVTFEVGVRNESMTTASPDFDVLVEAWVGVPMSMPASFTTTLRFTGLAPLAENRTTVDVTVPLQPRPVDVIIQVTADPPASTGGAVREANENNNVRNRTFPIF